METLEELEQIITGCAITKDGEIQSRHKDGTTTETRTCSKCGNTHPITHYPKTGTGGKYYRTVCKDCVREYNKQLKISLLSSEKSLTPSVQTQSAASLTPMALQNQINIITSLILGGSPFEFKVESLNLTMTNL